MSVQFKHRLIGTIVLVALLVIILPDVFDGQKSVKKEHFSAIPFAPKPVSEKPLVFDLNQPKNTAVNSPEKKVEPSDVIHDKNIHSADMAKETKSKDSLTQPTESPVVTEFKQSGWIIQLATLKSADGTRRLIEQLRKAGYQAHSYPRNPVDGQFNRIFVGPELSKSSMDSKLKKLKALTGLQGLVRKFDPTDH